VTAETATKRQIEEARVMVKLIRLGRSLVRALTDSYRPELHYMRGPGPKWRAKHGQPVF